ncbi:MAG: hypothetical protein EHM64_16365 [Ignavibacteriae bacterium]|nr:MAG: hypothetical protein EHM64_16365 [Ignavibacteriota bacterium]
MTMMNIKIVKRVLPVAVVVVVAAVLFALNRYHGIYDRYSWKNHIQEQAEIKLNGEVTRIQKIIMSIEQIPRNLSYVLEFSRTEKEHINFLLEAIVQNNAEVFGTCIAFEPYAFDKDTMYYAPYLFKKNGTYVYSDPTDSSDHYFNSDWYLIPKVLKKPVWIEPYYDVGESSGKIVLTTYSVPFYSFNGTGEVFKGIIAVDISLDWLSKLVSSIKLIDSSYTLLVSESGTILSSPNPEWPYNESVFSLAVELDLPRLREVGRDLQKGNSGFVNIGKLDKKRDWWVYYMPIPENKWGLLLLVPETQNF